MATINLGSIKFNWKGTYAGGTAYVVDDVVEYNGSSYICILASTGNLPTNATYFEQMSSAGTNGTDGTDLTTTLTTQGDIVYRNASGLARLGAGTSGQVLQTGGTGANVSWTDVGGGDYVKLASTTQTTGDSINSLSLDGYFDDNTYAAYEVYISDYNSGTSDSSFGFRVLVGNSVDTASNYYWHTAGYSDQLGATGQGLFREYGMPNSFPEIFRAMDNGDNANYRGSAKITIYNPESSGYKWIHMRNHHIYNNGTEYLYWNNLTDIYYRQTSVLTGVNFSTSGGQNFGGTFALYGLKK